MSVTCVCNCIGIQDAVVSSVVCKTRVSSLLCICDLSVVFVPHVLVFWLSFSVVVIFDLHLRWIFIIRALTSLFIMLTIITIAARGIVCLNVNYNQSGGTRTRSLWQNCRNILGVSLNRNANMSLYVAAGKSCMRSTMDEKVSFHSLMYATVCLQPMSGQRFRTGWLRVITTLCHSLSLRVVSGRRGGTGVSVGADIVARTCGR